MARRRVATWRRRGCIASSLMRSWRPPGWSRAASAPPSASSLCSSSQPRRARSSVSFSTAKEPPAGSVTRATWASWISSEEVLRATRRPRASGTPRAVSKGITVTEAAPPTPPAKAATVPRSMLTQGSYFVSMARPVTGVLDLAGGVRGARELQHPGPEPTGGAELGDGEELLVGDGVAELQQRRCLVDGEPEVAASARSQERRTGRQRPARARARRGRRRRGPRWRRPRCDRRARGPARPGAAARRRRRCPRPPEPCASALHGSTASTVPGAGATSRSARIAANASAAPTGSSGQSRTTGARSTYTFSSTVGRSATAMPPRPSRSQRLVAPFSRSVIASAAACFASGSARWARTSQPSSGRVSALPRVYGATPGSPVGGSPSRCSRRPSGGTSMPSRVVRVSLLHTRSSGSSSFRRPALRRTSAAAFSHCSRVALGCSSPPARRDRCSMVRTLGAGTGADHRL